jgi:hypothetical protein
VFWLLLSGALGCPSPAPRCSPADDEFWFEPAVSLCGIPHALALCPPWALLENPPKVPFTAAGAMSNGATSVTPSATPIDFVKSCFMTPASSF